METALLITSLTDLDNLKNNLQKFDRVYYGAEFCENLIPSNKEIGVIMDYVIKHGLKLSLVTPYVTNTGMNKLEKLFDFIVASSFFKAQKKCFEVVVNDYGVLFLINKKYHDINPVIGRVLNTMKTDPMILKLFDKMNDGCKTFIRHSRLQNYLTVKELNKFNVSRIGYNFPLHGIFPLSKKQGISSSVYYPFVFLSTTRYCIMRDCEKEYDSFSFIIDKCKRECQKYVAKLSGKNSNNLILKGNTYFYYKNIDNQEIEMLEKKGVNRLVFQSKP